jgi:hypothetical protein
VAPAIFGLLGVLVGALISGMAAYAMDRRSGWLAARAAALLTIEDLADASAELERAGSDISRARPAIRRALDGWEARREALLYRKGTSPSGVDAGEWLRVGALFRGLRAVDTGPDACARATELVSQILDALAVFRDDRHALPQVVRNAWRAMLGRSTAA